MTKSTKTVVSASVFLIQGGVDLKLVMSDGTTERVPNIPFGAMKKGFTHDRRKHTLTPCTTVGSKHGDRGFHLRRTDVSFVLYPQAKGHFFGGPQQERGPASTYDEMLEAIG